MLLHTTTRGSGEPVLLLHSGGMSSRQWKKLGELLEATHRVIAPDFLGSGENPPWPDDQSFEFAQDVDAVGELLVSLGRPAHVVGHSYGGLVAVTVARLFPGLVRSLTAYDPVAMGVLFSESDEEGQRSLASIGESAVFLDDARGGSAAWFEVFVDWWNGAGTWKNMAPAGQHAFLRVGRKVFYEVRSLMQDRTPASAYASVTAPALIFTGEHSPLAAQRVVAHLARALPHATSSTVAGAGHMGPITHAAVVNEAIAVHVRAAS